MSNKSICNSATRKKNLHVTVLWWWWLHCSLLLWHVNAISASHQRGTSVQNKKTIRGKKNNNNNNNSAFWCEWSKMKTVHKIPSIHEKKIKEKIHKWTILSWACKSNMCFYMLRKKGFTVKTKWRLHSRTDIWKQPVLNQESHILGPATAEHNKIK